MIHRERLLETFLHLVRIPSPSGQEEEVARAIVRYLNDLGADVETDEAGNLLAHFDGQGDPLLLTAHMDTVTPCDRINPVVRDGVIYSDGTSILGADDKSGVAIILEVLQVPADEDMPRRPLDILFTVEEEVGLAGARAFDMSRLRARMGIGLDSGGGRGIIIVSAPSQDSLVATVHGRSAHAGAHPEQGINAIRVAAEAIAAMPLGRIDEETTANIGVINGGDATNIVPDRVTMRGEARSRNTAKLEAQTGAMVNALESAAQAHGATVNVQVTRAYEAYNLDEDNPIVRLVADAMRSLDIEPCMVPSGGGSDGNIFNAAGIPMVQISAGMQEVHTCQEYVALDDMVAAAELVLACVKP
ncbi:MAG TPA: M20/M25/M40 family metallo-hydrolase [Chloroflexi bacterium]|jgi:tripeptide aminopeptidase|nr:M20/M25/M40 family metallo-hydrolase [Chloroflexota bacterium]